MSKITREEILKLAKLAHLRLDDDEVEKFSNEISDIITYAEMLDDVDTDDLRPTYQVTSLENIARPDTEVDYGINRTELLKNLPDRKDDLIKVKRMVG